MQIILIIIGLLLILMNVRFFDGGYSTLLKRIKNKRKPDSKADSVNTEDKSFSGVLEREKLDITEVDIRIGELRREFSETLVELQREIVDLNDKIEILMEAQSSEEIIDTINIADIETEDSSRALDTVNMTELESKTFSKSDQVSDLLQKGYSIDDICVKLEMGRGEVLLIKKLYQL